MESAQCHEMAHPQRSDTVTKRVGQRCRQKNSAIKLLQIFVGMLGIDGGLDLSFDPRVRVGDVSDAAFAVHPAKIVPESNRLRGDQLPIEPIPPG